MQRKRIDMAALKYVAAAVEARRKGLPTLSHDTPLAEGEAKGALIEWT